MRRGPTAKSLQKQVDDWNAKVPIGTQVDYRSHPAATPQRFTTSTPAQLLSDHTCVVWLDGKSGCVATAACRPFVGGDVCLGCGALRLKDAR